MPVHRAARRLPLDALAIGAMSPDFEYVLRLAAIGRWWHSPAGLVLACVPASLAVWAVWRVLVRPSLLPLLPDGLRRTLPATRPVYGAVVGWAAAAVLVGALTHVAWDGFTHRTGWAVLRIPALLQPAAALGIHRPWYNVLQHGSTLLGAAVLATSCLRWAARVPARGRRLGRGQGRALVRAVAWLAGASGLAAVANGARVWQGGWVSVIGYAAVGWMAGLAAAGVMYALVVRASSHRQPENAGHRR